MDLGPTWITPDDLILRSLTTSTKILFSSKVTFADFREQNMDISFGGTSFNLLHWASSSRIPRSLVVASVAFLVFL